MRITTLFTISLLALLSLGAAHRPRPAGQNAQPCPESAAGYTRTGEHSSGCLACHDGVTAQDLVPLDPWVRQARLNWDKGNHPVMVAYAEAYRRDPSRYVPVSQLDPRIKLVNGTIQCATCHTVSVTERWALAVPNQNDRLCLSCHRL